MKLPDQRIHRRKEGAEPTEQETNSTPGGWLGMAIDPVFSHSHPLGFGTRKVLGRKEKPEGKKNIRKIKNKF